VGACFTVCVYLVPGVDVAYRSSLLTAGYEAFSAAVALAAAYLLLGRGRGDLRPADHLVAAAFLIWAVENLLFLVVPTAHAYGHVSRFSTWSSAGARVAEGSLLVAATFVSNTRLRVDRATAIAATVTVATAACLVIAGSAALLAHRLPLAIDPHVSPVGTGTRLPAGSGAMAATLLLSSVLFGVAAARLRPAANDALIAWLRVGLVAAVLAGVNFALFPSLYSQWVYAGDILQFCFALAILFGVSGAVSLYWRQLIELAVLDERRRLARDLHDGVAQELAFIALQVQEAVTVGSPRSALQKIGSAAERALVEARLAIATLSEPLDPSALHSVQRATRDITRTHSGVRIEITGEDFDAGPTACETVHRVVREAILNAVSHGSVRSARVRLRARPTCVVRVVDAGSGFVASAPTDGFGLVSMKERAQAIGGTLAVRSYPGRGTIVQLELPPQPNGTTPEASSEPRGQRR
jgi:signal transduction histidine kinase